MARGERSLKEREARIGGWRGLGLAGWGDSGYCTTTTETRVGHSLFTGSRTHGLTDVSNND